MNLSKKIMVVDDALSILTFLKNVLTDAGYDVITIADGEQALARLKNFKPDLILLDIIMPGMDGYEVCRKIRQNPADSHIKIIMLSSESKLEERLRGYKVGADDYIAKPFEEHELLAKVRVFLRLKRVEDELVNLNDKLNQQVQIRTQQLSDAEKMATVGRLTAGIVHNLNNPLQAMMSISQILALRHPNISQIKDLRKACDRMYEIIATILNTGKRESELASVDVDLNEVLRDIVELKQADHFFKYNIHTKMELQPLPIFRGVYAHFSQSLGNLIDNATDAMYYQNKGVLTIQSSVTDRLIRIKISDTGTGIDTDKIVMIFDPFFTTKPLTADDNRPTGTGLGLASCKEMIESYKGNIQVDSKTGKGTTFIVELPIFRTGQRVLIEGVSSVLL
ncbi:hybrid sensor histidine kinase/response regulator [Desulfococcaceae bacterium HSG7]|nr:hybrid sensor histidine kinase/response regulator [Desulfococcaceae bacterium HSG7]